MNFDQLKKSNKNEDYISTELKKKSKE